MSRRLSFVHRFDEGAKTNAPPLLLLHGTGGDENDLVPLGRAIAPRAPLLSVRGKVLENGMPRFFRRLAEGVFDEDDVRSRAQELADFVEEARACYEIASPIALGYSNGANIAAATLLMRPQAFSGAILLRAMVPLLQTPPVDLTGKAVLIVSGIRDPIIPPAEAARLASLLQKHGAIVEHRKLPIGHELSPEDVAISRAWLQGHERPAMQ
ncbi:MAG TPA: alpha/beta hydrolase [Xanthobacteraceae bacterium]